MSAEPLEHTTLDRISPEKFNRLVAVAGRAYGGAVSGYGDRHQRRFQITVRALLDELGIEVTIQ